MPSLFTRSQDQDPDISVHLLEDTENEVGVTDKIYVAHDPIRVSRDLDHRQGRSLSTRPMCRCFLYTVIAVLAFLGLVQIFSWVLQLVEARADLLHAPCWCGDSDDDAIAMGCRYDHIAVDWLQPDCIDDDLVQEFDRSGPRQDGSWPYFEAEYDNLTSRYSFIPLHSSEIDVFAREGKEYFTTREWHVSHCLFTWQKQFRALSNGKAMEPWNNSEEHIKHCSDYILEAMRSGSRPDDIETLILGVDRHKDE